VSLVVAGKTKEGWLKTPRPRPRAMSSAIMAGEVCTLLQQHILRTAMSFCGQLDAHSQPHYGNLSQAVRLSPVHVYLHVPEDRSPKAGDLFPTRVHLRPAHALTPRTGEMPSVFQALNALPPALLGLEPGSGGDTRHLSSWIFRLSKTSPPNPTTSATSGTRVGYKVRFSETHQLPPHATLRVVTRQTTSGSEDGNSTLVAPDILVARPDGTLAGMWQDGKPVLQATHAPPMVKRANALLSQPPPFAYGMADSRGMHSEVHLLARSENEQDERLVPRLEVALLYHTPSTFTDPFELGRIRFPGNASIICHGKPDVELPAYAAGAQSHVVVATQLG
jgi:hypothetical protein